MQLTFPEQQLTGEKVIDPAEKRVIDPTENRPFEQTEKRVNGLIEKRAIDPTEKRIGPSPEISEQNRWIPN